MSLISADQTFQLATILTGLAAFGFWSETTQLGRKLSGVLIILFLGVVLANIRLIPHTAAMYDTVSSLLVPLAIPMLLFKADLKQVIAEIGPMFKAFVASAGVIAFSIALLTLLFDFGPYGAQVAGTLAWFVNCKGTIICCRATGKSAGMRGRVKIFLGEMVTPFRSPRIVDTF